MLTFFCEYQYCQRYFQKTFGFCIWNEKREKINALMSALFSFEIWSYRSVNTGNCVKCFIISKWLYHAHASNALFMIYNIFATNQNYNLNCIKSITVEIGWIFVLDLFRNFINDKFVTERRSLRRNCIKYYNFGDCLQKAHHFFKVWINCQRYA